MQHLSIACKVHTSTWVTLAVIPLSVFLLMFAPDSWGYENGILENLQMLLLLSGLVWSLTATANKEIFRLAAAIIFFLMLREVNCGRVLFWSTSGEMFHCGPPQDYLKWKDIPNGSIFRTAVYTLATVLCLWTLCNRAVFRQIPNLLFRQRIPLWETILLITGVLTGIIAERVYPYIMLEEVAEILTYTSFSAIIYLYSRSKLAFTP